MRRGKYTLRAWEVHGQARRLVVKHLGWEDYKGSVPAGLLARLVILACVWQASLSCLAELLRGSPSHETLRKALQANLPRRPRELLDGLIAALHEALPAHLSACPLPMALDLHQRPYYGRMTRGTTRRQKKKSTRKSFTYATLAVLSPEGCFSVALLLVRPHMRLGTILEELFAQAQRAGLKPRYLLADKEFYAAEVFDWLQRRGIPFVVPAKRRGKAGSGNSWLFERSLPTGWYQYSWLTRLRLWDAKAGKQRLGKALAVQVRMCVARHPVKDKVLVYATWGLVGWSVMEVFQSYRKRFGIETSYRQLGQCLAATSSKDERVRLLYVGLALLLVNLWAWMHAELFATGPRGKRSRCLAALRLSILNRALVLDLVAHLAPLLQWTAQRPMPQRLADIVEP
jgi:Transposase DDE domain